MTDSFSFPANTFILVGKVVKPHGLQGEIKIFSFSGQPDNFDGYKRLQFVDFSGHISPPYRVAKSRVSGKVVIVKLDGISDREKADAICSMGVLVHKADLPRLDSNEFYYHEFIGLSVQTEDGKKLGEIDNIFFNGGQEIMEIQGEGQHYLVPLLDELIINQDKNKIIIAPPPGLLDIN